MLSAIFIAFLDAEPQSHGTIEDFLLLIIGVGLIVLVFVLRRWLHSGSNHDNTNSLI